MAGWLLGWPGGWPAGCWLAAWLALPECYQLKAAAAGPKTSVLAGLLDCWLQDANPHLRPQLLALLQWCQPQLQQLWPQGVAQRRLQGMAWAWLAAAGEEQVRAEAANLLCLIR